MVRHFCDICGQEITDHANASRYKVKREVHSWYESWWERMYVHDSCWRKMRKYIKETMDGERRTDG